MAILEAVYYFASIVIHPRSYIYDCVLFLAQSALERFSWFLTVLLLPPSNSLRVLFD